MESSAFRPGWIVRRARNALASSAKGCRSRLPSAVARAMHICYFGGALMPYASNEDLPRPVRAHLPEHAQDIYRAAFNHAWERWGEDAMSHRIAWAAVKRSYVKSDGAWVPRTGPMTEPWSLAR